MLERIERNSGTLLMLSITASGGRGYGLLNKLRGAGYVVKCDHRTVKDGAWPAEALAITEAGRAALGRKPGQALPKLLSSACGWHWGKACSGPGARCRGGKITSNCAYVPAHAREERPAPCTGG